MGKPFITPFSENPSTLSLIGELSQRAAVVRQMVPYRASVAVRDAVEERTPAGAQGLKKALKISKVDGLPENQVAFVVHATPRGKATKKAEQDMTVLYVSLRTGLLRRIPESMRILEAHSPWTIDTLPFQPDEKYTVVVSRRVNPRVVAQVREQRRKDRPVWRRKMAREGLREIHQSRRIRKNRALKAIPDVAYDSLRLEFGLGGAPSKPHWRPAILKLASGGLTGMIRTDREFVRTMTDPTYQGWKSWKPAELQGSISTSQAETYVPFQKVLGIRVGGEQ